jgi:plastocyanin
MKRLALVVSAWLPIATAGLVIAGAPNAGVAVQLFRYRPDRVEVTAGTRVTWTNQDEIGHTVTAGTPDRPDAAFDLRLDGRGATAAVAFDRPGVFPYFCARHPSMRGEIHVNRDTRKGA